MLRTRVITALALLAGFLCVLFVLPAAAAAVAFAGVAALAAWEWGGLLRLGSTARLAFAAFVLASCGLAFRFLPAAQAWLLPLSVGFWLLVVPVWLWRGWRVAGHWPAGVLVGWILVLPAWLALVTLHQRSPWLLLATMATVWVADIGAYFAGRAFGRHKLAPAISPGKTWEGAAGGLVGVFLFAGVAAVASGSPLPSPVAGAVALSLFVAYSIVGDLFESLAKRQAGVKDSGRLLPGHGGVLDRIDSQTSALPLAALLLQWTQS